MRSSGSEGAPANERGFTLLELAVVLALLGALLLAVLPRLAVFEDEALRSDARRLASVIRQLDDSAASDKSFYSMSVAMGSGSLELKRSVDGLSWASPDGMPPVVRLSKATGIASLTQGSTTTESGEATVVFGPSGAAPFSISLVSGTIKCTISYNPYSGKVRIT